MSKFRKRIQKAQGTMVNALVIGTGFRRLDELTDIFKTVFVISSTLPEIKRKNLIFREGHNSLDPLSEITSIFIDKNQIHTLENLVPVMLKHHPYIFIEGNEVIGREFSLPLYQNGFRAIEQQGFFHTWKKIK
jgi:hypothetical protein